MKRIYIYTGIVLTVTVSLLLVFLAYRQGLIRIGGIRQGEFVAIEEKKLSKASHNLRVEKFAHDLMIPWDMVFTGPDRMLVSERSGYIREIIKGVLKKDPLITFPEVATSGEAGLMGLALDPDYSRSKLLYACVAYKDGASLQTKVIQLHDTGEDVQVKKTILDNIPAAQYHDGCRIAFGPDKKLYITTGDATDRNLAQSKTSIAGKILRLNGDGSIPQDNPFPNSPIYSLGHRNPQGLAWHPTTKTLYETEHGPSGFDGPPGGDEVNKIVSGGNYGWPLVSHQKHDDRFIDPLLVFTPAEAPGSALFYTGQLFLEFRNDLFFGALKGEGLIRLDLDSSGKSVVSYEKLPLGDLGRIRTVIQGPDGALYISTSNRDGRGKVRVGDDAIYKIAPKN